MFVIEDAIHAEWCSEFKTYQEVISEFQTKSKIAWHAAPNVCPCMSGKTCGRDYYISEFDSSLEPWREVTRTHALSNSLKGMFWKEGFNSYENA